MKNLVEFLNRLEDAKIYCRLNKVNKEFIMAEAAVPGQRREIEFSADEVRIEKFVSDGEIFDESEIISLFSDFSD